MQHRWSAVIAVLSLALTFRPAPGTAKTSTASRPNNAFVCGTSIQRQHEAVTRSRYRDSLLRRHPERSRLRQDLLAQPRAQTADIGDIAIIEDDGTLQTTYNLLDLSGKSILFVPAGSSSLSYQVSTATKPFDAGTGTLLPLSDDDSKAVSLTPSFTFYGKSYSSVNVNSDGNLTFDERDVASSARDLGRFAWGPPRIGPLFSDLDPGAGSVFYRQDSDGALFVWQNVPNFGTSLFNSFSVKLFNNGNIEFVYGSPVDATEAIAGISPGAGEDGVSAADFSTLQQAEVLAGTIAEVFTTNPQLMETAVARKFFQTHADDYDQLVVFLTFPYDMQGSFSYELNVKNDVKGIGLDPANDSADYGSGGRLKSFVLMGALDQDPDGQPRFPDDPYQKFMRTYNSVEVVAHEVAHRWLAFPSLWDGQVNTLALLHANDQSHWSFFFNADASLMEGNQILDRGAGLGNQRFATSEVTNKLSALDLYLMGFRDARDVPPMFYVRNPTGARGLSSNSLPSFSSTSFGGTRFDFTIDNIITGNGVRQPSVLQSQKVHRLAFILVSNASHPATSDQLIKLQRIHDAFVPYFNQLTGGQSWVVTDLHSSPATTPSDIYFPYFQGDTQRYTGIAVANWGARPADVLFSAFDNSGSETSTPAGIVNPRMITIPPSSQIALLGEQIHGLALDGAPRNGWIQAKSSSSQVSGFFIEGDIAETFLDGAVADGKTSTWLCFTRAHGTTGTLRNQINVVNPNTDAAHLALKLFGPDGRQQGSTMARVLGGHGRLAEDLSTLFPGTDPNFSGYIVVTSDVGVVGYESLGGSSTIYSLPAQSVATATTLYSAQFASGPAGTIRYFTDINVINTSAERRHVQVSLIGNNGAALPGVFPADFWLDAGEQKLARGEQFFGLQDAAVAGMITEGTLIFAVSGPGVIGDVTFGDPVAAKFMAALPLDSTPLDNMVLSQVAQGAQGTGTSYFTGLAMYNPNPNAVSVTFDVYSEQGAHTGNGVVTLGQGERFSKTLPQIIPGFGQQMRGYIRVGTTGGPVIAFGIFGEAAEVRFLAAIPPQPIFP